MPLLLGSEEHTSELQSPCNLVCRFCLDRKSTRLNSSHLVISYAVFCLKKKTQTADGSIIMVVATDAPIDPGHLNRLAARAMLGLARTGSSESNFCFFYVIAVPAAPALLTQADSSMY